MSWSALRRPSIQLGMVLTMQRLQLSKGCLPSTQSLQRKTNNNKKDRITISSDICTLSLKSYDPLPTNYKNYPLTNSQDKVLLSYRAFLDNSSLLQACPDALQPSWVLWVRATTAAVVLEHHGVIDQASPTLHLPFLHTKNVATLSKIETQKQYHIHVQSKALLSNIYTCQLLICISTALLDVVSKPQNMFVCPQDIQRIRI